MATKFSFNSPGVKFIESVTPNPTQQLTGTRLGVVGEFQKGAAFQVMNISDKAQFQRFLGNQTIEMLGDTPKFVGAYAANSFLEESNNLSVVRVLGLSGYNAGKAWVITVDGGVDLNTTGQTNVVNDTTTTVSGGTFQGETLPVVPGTVITTDVEYTRAGSVFTGTYYIITVDSYNIVGSTPVHDITYDTYTITGSPLTQYDDTVVAVIRSRGDYEVDDLEFDTTSLTISGITTGNIFGDFTLTASSTGGTESYKVSLDVNKRNFITKVLGDKVRDKQSRIWVEKTYPDLMNKLAGDGKIFQVKSCGEYDTEFADYNEQYRSAETPWIVSELRGNKLDRLFKFYTINDGDSANKDIKISVLNINPDTKEFDILIRSFNDTDENIQILESFTRCNMDEGSNNYIGKRIGAIDPDTNTFKYERRSDYVYLLMADEPPFDAFPAGFEGYEFRDFENLTNPQLLYKTEYASTDRLRRTYLGISEKAYDTENDSGDSINPEFFEYYGVRTPNNVTKIKGFHMDADVSGITFNDGSVVIGEFEPGIASFKDPDDITDPSNPYSQRFSTKFTLVPYYGFDGWDIYRTERTNTDVFSEGRSRYTVNNDYDAYIKAVNVFDNKEESFINLLITPNVNWSNHSVLIQNTIEMVEDERGDCFYVIDPPNLLSPDYANEISNLFDITGIDSSYVGTYAPWIEVLDLSNNRLVKLPPSTKVATAMAFNDNIRAPWYAPAGLSVGSLDALRTTYKLRERDRDTIYTNRINAIADFTNEGVVIWGQKTAFPIESPIDRINVRRLILDLKYTITNIAKRFLFEQNDQIVREQFIDAINPILANIQRERGLFNYEIVDDGLPPENLDRGIATFVIRLQPIKALEFIGIEFSVTPTGVEFDS